MCRQGVKQMTAHTQIPLKKQILMPHLYLWSTEFYLSIIARYLKTTEMSHVPRRWRRCPPPAGPGRPGWPPSPAAAPPAHCTCNQPGTHSVTHEVGLASSNENLTLLHTLATMAYYIC